MKLALDKCREKFPELRIEFQELAKIMETRPREYYRYAGALPMSSTTPNPAISKCSEEKQHEVQDLSLCLHVSEGKHPRVLAQVQ